MMQDISKRLAVPGPPYDTELMRIDRLTRFLVLADERPETGFRHYALTGRLTRLGLQLGWNVEDTHAYIGRRYQSYLALFKSRPAMFMETTARLRAEYGDELLRRWGALAAE